MIKTTKILAITAAFIFVGCGVRPVVTYKVQEVKIPVKCNITPPPKPNITNDTLNNVLELQTAYILTRNALIHCIGKEDE